MAAFDELADLSLSEDDLRYEPYNRSSDVTGFDCGDEGLNEFLRDPQEVAAYQEDGLGSTTLVYWRGCLVGFFTLCNDGLEIKYVDSRKLSNRVTKRQKEIVRTYPSIKIGRFAVDSRVHGRGIGTYMMRYIVGLAMAQRERGVAVRLLILQALPNAQTFYERKKFEYTLEKGRNRGKENKTMFLDLDAIAEAANEVEA